LRFGVEKLSLSKIERQGLMTSEM